MMRGNNVPRRRGHIYSDTTCTVVFELEVALPMPLRWHQLSPLVCPTHWHAYRRSAHCCKTNSLAPFEVKKKGVILTLVLTQGGNVARVHLSRMSQLAVRISLASLSSD